jgi:hypothetical protein
VPDPAGTTATCPICGSRRSFERTRTTTPRPH